eukprot:ctg_1780.g383
MDGNDGNDRSSGPSDGNEDDDQQRPHDGRSKEDQTDRSSRPGRSDSGTRDSEFNLTSTRDTNQERLPRNRIYEYIRSLSPPETLRRFADSAPTDVQTAMKQMLVHMLGNLPALSFGVAVTTVGERLAELLYCTAMTGYMLRNAEYRMSLSRALRLPSSPGDGDDADGNRRSRILPESTLRIQNTDGSVTEMDAAQYVQELRNEQPSGGLLAHHATGEPGENGRERPARRGRGHEAHRAHGAAAVGRGQLHPGDGAGERTVVAAVLADGVGVRGESEGDEGDRGSGEKGTDGDNGPPPPTR